MSQSESSFCGSQISEEDHKDDDVHSGLEEISYPPETIHTWVIRSFVAQTRKPYCFESAAPTDNCPNPFNIFGARKPHRVIFSDLFPQDAITVNLWQAHLQRYENQGSFFLNMLVNQPFSQNKAGKYLESYCDVEILNCFGSRVFSFSSLSTPPNNNQFLLRNICNISELERQNPNLYGSGTDLKMVITLGRAALRPTDVHGLSQLCRKNSEYDKSTDVLIKTEERDFPCHRSVLAAALVDVDAIFEIQQKEDKSAIVNLKGIFDASTVEEFLLFIYNKLPPPDFESSCFQLLPVAQYFKVAHITELCVEKMGRIINVHNSTSILQLAENFDIHVLKDTAIQFILDHWEQVTNTSGWKDIPAEMSKNLLYTFVRTLGCKKPRFI